MIVKKKTKKRNVWHCILISHFFFIFFWSQIGWKMVHSNDNGIDNDNDKNNNSDVNSLSNGQIRHREVSAKHDQSAQLKPVDPNFHPQIRWPDLTAQIFLHAGAIYGLIFQFYTVKLFTIIWCKYFLLSLFEFNCC